MIVPDFDLAAHRDELAGEPADYVVDRRNGHDWVVRRSDGLACYAVRSDGHLVPVNNPFALPPEP
jgi:hypothetical protein